MRKVIVSEFVTLDGVMEDPSWTFRFSSEEQQRFKFDELVAGDALLRGRVTYEGFAAAWPPMTEQYQEYADMMNGCPKYVISTTLEEPLEWQNSTLIKNNVAQEITRLRQQPGKNIGITVGATLVRYLLREDLLDELGLIIHPVVVGAGRRLFEDGGDQKGLKLVEMKTFGTGVVYLTYHPDREEVEG